MFKILDVEKQVEVTSLKAKTLYPKCNYLLIDTVNKDGVVAGIIYAISEEPKTLRELTQLEDKLQEEGHTTFIGGDYYPNCLFDYVQIVEGTK